MPLFFFHRQAQGLFYEDPDGSDLPDLDAARTEAIVAACDMWAEAICKNIDLSDDRFVVMDDLGRPVLTVPFTDALPDGLRQRIGGR